MKSLQTWFARQTLTVKLLVTVPVLAIAVLWSVVPDGTAPPSSAVASNRPVLASGAPAAAATVAPHEEPTVAQSGLTWVSALRTLVSVGVVLALIVASARGLKYFMASSGQLPGSTGTLKVVETTYLPSPSGKGRAAIHLLETADGRQLLIGATEQQLTLLSESEDHSGRIRLRVSEALQQTEHAAQTEPATFERLLDAAVEKTPPIEPQLSDALHRLRAARQRLEAAS